MNKQRRKELQRILDIVQEAIEGLEPLRDEEIEYRDNIPENMQSSEIYEKANDAVDALDEAISCLEETTTYIQSAIE